MATVRPGGVTAAAVASEDVADAEDRKKFTNLRSIFDTGFVARAWQFWRPHFVLALLVGCGYFFGTYELLQPAESYVARFLRALLQVALALFVACWVSMVYHGPGCIPPLQRVGDDCSRGVVVPELGLPDVLAAALAVGRSCAEPYSFDSTAVWCSSCACWRPPLAKHCVHCRSCNLWVHHHSLRAGTCVGFYNSRSFLQMSIYSQGLLVWCVVAVLARVVGAVSGQAALDFWQGLRLLAFVCFTGVGTIVWLKECRPFLALIYAGWPFKQMYDDFQVFVFHAEQLVHTLKHGCEDWATDGEAERMAAALRGVMSDDGMLRGLFSARSKTEALTMHFGEPPSMRWFLPCVRGGFGDPICPSEKMLDHEACLAWASLGKTYEAYSELHTRWREKAEAQLIAMERCAARLKARPLPVLQASRAAVASPIGHASAVAEAIATDNAVVTEDAV
eukprot:TRINITY_DN73532_c0_g1_i1.p1 TRINITY_DN73532_c0_g1~~TRINITY_DN73532_c0_g1_i1.p1  ORF type:complete len:486 (-),score=76.69 TRINITY_DN73532_c0_g1_i1:121-1467(-)